MRVSSLAAAVAAFLIAASTGARADMDTQATPHTKDNEFRTDALGHGAVSNKKPEMSMEVSDVLRALFDAGKNKDWDRAKAKLAEARAFSKPNDVDLYEIEVASGYISFNTTIAAKSNDFSATLDSYKKQVANPMFDKMETVENKTHTLKNGMILANQAGDFPGAIAFGEKLVAMGGIDDQSATTLALAYFGHKDYAKAESMAQSAINAETAASLKPNDSAVQIVAQSKAALATH